MCQTNQTIWKAPVMTSERTKTIPAAECYFVADVEIKERKSDDSRSTPFAATARTGDALNHAYWGRVVHDLDGMRVKPRIPIDYNHNPDLIIGYANRFNTESGDLEIRGALTPSKHEEFSKAQEVIDKAEQGVPWEMSISFPGDITVEEVPEGEQVEVNQRQFTGPLSVIRSWPLRAVAVTPMGQDAATAIQFSEDQTVTCTYINQEADMAATKDELTVAEAEVEIKDDRAVDVADTDSAEVEAETTVDAEAVDATDADELSAATAEDFRSRFGHVQGSLYFADGISLDEATAKELERLQAENTELRSRKTDEDALEDASSFSQGGEIDSNVLTAVPGDVCEQVIRKT